MYKTVAFIRINKLIDKKGHEEILDIWNQHLFANSVTVLSNSRPAAHNCCHQRGKNVITVPQIYKLENIKFSCKYIATNIHKTIVINYNACRITELAKGGYKLSTCLKH